MRVIYVDALFLLNFTADYFLLFLTAKSAGLYPSRRRLLLGALLGAVFAVLFYFLPIKIPFALLLRLMSGCCIVLAAFGSMQGVRLLRLCGSFLLMTLLLAGVVFLLSQRIGGISVHNGVLYAEISVAVMLLGFSLSYGLANLVLGRGRGHVERIYHEISVSLHGKTARFRALSDSGNLLRDPVSGSRVIVTDGDSLLPLLGTDALTQLRKTPPPLELLWERYGIRFWLLPADTAAGHCVFPVFRAEKLYVDGKPSREYLIAVAPQPVEVGGDCRALMGG